MRHRRHPGLRGPGGTRPGEGVYQQSSPRTITDLLENIESVDSLTAGPVHAPCRQAARDRGRAGPRSHGLALGCRVPADPQVISSYSSVALADCGTGVTHNAMSGIMQSADNLVTAAGYAVSSAKRARSTLDWLTSHGYGDLAGTPLWRSRTKMKSPPGWTWSL